MVSGRKHTYSPKSSLTINLFLRCAEQPDLSFFVANLNTPRLDQEQRTTLIICNQVFFVRTSANFYKQYSSALPSQKSPYRVSSSSSSLILQTDLTLSNLNTTPLVLPILTGLLTPILHAPDLTTLHTPLMRHTPNPLSMLLRIHIIHQQLSMLAISKRLIPSRLHDVEPAPPPLRRLAEDGVDFF